MFLLLLQVESILFLFFDYLIKKEQKVFFYYFYFKKIKKTLIWISIESFFQKI